MNDEQCNRRYHHHHHYHIRLFRSGQTQLIQNTSIKSKEMEQWWTIRPNTNYKSQDQQIQNSHARAVVIKAPEHIRWKFTKEASSEEHSVNRLRFDRIMAMSQSMAPFMAHPIVTSLASFVSVFALVKDNRAHCIGYISSFHFTYKVLTTTQPSYHGLRGSASPVLTATGFVNGRWQFSTPTE